MYSVFSCIQQDNEKIGALHEEREKKVSELEVQIDRMRNQQEQLQKKLKEEADRKIKMERDMQKQLQRIKEMEEQMSQQQKVLKRKTEEVVAAHRKLRSVGKQGSEEKDRYCGMFNVTLAVYIVSEFLLYCTKAKVSA